MSRELPAGEPLSLDAVAQLVGVPRGSAYHALTKLSGEGLVNRTADGRYIVTPLTLAAVADGLQARRAIELGVAACTVGRLTDPQLQALAAAAEATRPATNLEVNSHLQNYSAFHEFFVGLAGSAALVDAHRRVNTAAMIMSVTRQRGADSDRALAAAAEAAYKHHMALLAAYEAGDLAAASATIQRHIDDAVVFTRRQLESVGGEL